MKLPISWLRWVFLVLYVLVVISLLALGIANDGIRWGSLILAGIFLAAQAVFVFGAGTLDLCRPIKKRRLILPVIVASLMGAIITGGATLALGELLRQNKEDWFEYFFWGMLAASWIVWGCVFFIYTRKLDRYNALKRITLWLLAGSLLELVASIPSHLIVSRRPGCFVGMGTMFGIIAGLWVMLWAFGPGIVLLFLRERHSSGLKDKNAEGYSFPDK